MVVTVFLYIQFPRIPRYGALVCTSFTDFHYLACQFPPDNSLICNGALKRLRRSSDANVILRFSSNLFLWMGLALVGAMVDLPLLGEVSTRYLYS